MLKRDELLIFIQATGSTPLRATRKKEGKYQFVVYVAFGTHRDQQVHSTPNCFTKGVATKTCTLQCRDVYFERRDQDNRNRLASSLGLERITPDHVDMTSDPQQDRLWCAN